MNRRFAGPGDEVGPMAKAPPEFIEVVDPSEVRKKAVWDQYLDDPSEKRLGICCSGGGIRSAAYSLGALQVLRRRGLLHDAEHLSAVSGGGYMAIAHAVMVDQTLHDDNQPPILPKDPGGDEVKEEQFFGKLPPWALGSPEEQHLRDHSTYLAPGFAGKVWMGQNLLYGILRHLAPFAAGLYLIAAAAGLVYAQWLGPRLRDPSRAHAVFWWPWVWTVVGVSAVIGLLFVLRQWIQEHSGDGGRLTLLQTAIARLLLAQLILAIVLLGLPALMLFLSEHPIAWIRSVATTAATLQIGSLSLMAIIAYLIKRVSSRRWFKLLSALTFLVAPLVVGIPFVAMLYWVARRSSFFALPFWLAVASVAVLVVISRLNETTPNMHLFYRERLASAFVGKRQVDRRNNRAFLGYGQPPWKDAILFSKLAEGEASAKLPNLIVCAALNASQDVPPGRLAASFTFEKDYSGGPLTGYVPTKRMEEAAGKGVLTLPAMMAISGAALSPSMGKMTIPWLRPLLAIFNARLGVWLPNPLLDHSVGARGVRRIKRRIDPTPPSFGTALPKVTKWQRPGTLYVLREALGLNHLHRRFVYITDGGHWENLGLVELLRRGCGEILCFDAAGGDIYHFHTIAEAITLARSDLGVEININLTPLRPVDGVSPADHVTADILYPDGTTGVLVFAKAAMASDTPEDLRDYREQDPRFPSHSTSDQLFNDRRFESYRALGAHAAEGAVDSLIAWRTGRRAAAAGGHGQLAPAAMIHADALTPGIPPPRPDPTVVLERGGPTHDS
jgi:hypothetical protein